VLYFIHGYMSSPTGEKAVLFKKTLHAIPITYRTCPPEDLDITDALDHIERTIHADPDVGLIGSSLGGFLATATALHNTCVKKIALLNPAVIPPDTDLSQIEDMPQNILKDMMNPSLFTTRLPAHLLILRGTRDTVVPDTWIETFANAQHAKIMYLDDDHQFTRNMQRLPEILAPFFANP
jgi:predicted esterase YcpF (UPF0227 family)